MTGYKSKKAAAQDKLAFSTNDSYIFKQPKQSEWKCHLFGTTPQNKQSIALPSTFSIWDRPVYQPSKQDCARPGALDFMKVKSK